MGYDSSLMKWGNNKDTEPLPVPWANDRSTEENSIKLYMYDRIIRRVQPLSQ